MKSVLFPFGLDQVLLFFTMRVSLHVCTCVYIHVFAYALSLSISLFAPTSKTTLLFGICQQHYGENQARLQVLHTLSHEGDNFNKPIIIIQKT